MVNGQNTATQLRGPCWAQEKRWDLDELPVLHSLREAQRVTQARSWAQTFPVPHQAGLWGLRRTARAAGEGLWWRRGNERPEAVWDKVEG